MAEATASANSPRPKDVAYATLQGLTPAPPALQPAPAGSVDYADIDHTRPALPQGAADYDKLPPLDTSAEGGNDAEDTLHALPPQTLTASLPAATGAARLAPAAGLATAQAGDAELEDVPPPRPSRSSLPPSFSAYGSGPVPLPGAPANRAANPLDTSNPFVREAEEERIRSSSFSETSADPAQARGSAAAADGDAGEEASARARAEQLRLRRASAAPEYLPTPAGPMTTAPPRPPAKAAGATPPLAGAPHAATIEANNPFLADRRGRGAGGDAHAHAHAAIVFGKAAVGRELGMAGPARCSLQCGCSHVMRMCGTRDEAPLLFAAWV